MREEERLGHRQSEHYDEKWNARFEELLDYESEHGDCIVPCKQGKLGIWVRTQRVAYMAGSLAQDRIERLDGIGFKWKQRDKVPWETRFDQLVQYKAKHGDCNISRSQGQLGHWVNKQRFIYKKGKLSQDRIKRLNVIGFDWTPQRGNSRKTKAPPSTQKSSRKERVSSPSTNVNSPSAIDGTRGVEPNGFKGEGRNATSVLLPLKVPSKRSNHNSGTESDEEVDEIGALIYDQAMRQRQKKARPKAR